MSFPLPPNEAERLEELRRYAVLDTPPEKAFDDITALAAQIFAVPIAAVTLVDAKRQWFKSCFGLETRETERGIAFCTHTILDSEVMVVPDASVDVRFANNPLVTGAMHVRFYAGAPLCTSNGLNLGTLTILDTKPRDFSAENVQALTNLATLVVDELELRYQIGERRRAAESLRLLEAAVQQSSESVVITSANLISGGPEIIFVNPAFTAMTGYRSEEVIGKTPQMFQGAKTDRGILDQVHAELAAGGECRFETINYRKDGSEFMIACRISPIRDSAGKVTHFICFQCDSTETNRVSVAILQAKEEAERANRAKSVFLSRMSHELRTPLHAILGFAQLLEMDQRTREDHESLAHIVGAGRHLLALINEVLDIARVEAGKLALTLEPVGVREALEEALSLVRPLAAERRVSLQPLAGDLACQVHSSAQRFKQVMLNLLSNAVKFNSANGTVTVCCTEIADHVRIEVADTGRGIAAENLERLFVPFERLDIGDAAVEGIGLGLSLSKHLIEAMGGMLGVESEPGRGTTFWVELPLIKSIAADPALARESDRPDLVDYPHSARPRTVLYIEDNLSNLRLVERILARRPEITLLSAAQGRIGLQLAREQRPDLLLLDLHLPDIQGDEILRQLRADPRTAGLPVVMISADATAAQIERLHAAGAQDYLTKPIDVRRFLAVIDAVEPRPTQSRAV